MCLAWESQECIYLDCSCFSTATRKHKQGKRLTMNFSKKALNWWQFLPKTCLLMIAQGFLNAQSGSLQKWLAQCVAKELFLKQSSQTCSIASLAQKEKFPPNSQWGGQRQVLGSLVCLTHLWQWLISSQPPTFLRSSVVPEGPCRWPGQAAPWPGKGSPAFWQEETTLTLHQSGWGGGSTALQQAGR